MTDVLPIPHAEAPPPQPPWLEELPPAQIVTELDRYIVGQQAAKRAVAIAIRNRWRRSQTPESIRDEITPYNIILIGPTGVGKTEIARRLARLAGAPFIKVEASRFTEGGYVGRGVGAMGGGRGSWSTRASRWFAPNAKTRSTAKRRSGPRNGCSTCCCHR